MPAWPPDDDDGTLDQSGCATVTYGATPGLVIAEGVLDLSMSDRLRHAVRAAIGFRPPVVTVDLTAVRMIDARSISVLVGCRQLALDTGGDLRVTGATGLVRKVMEITGVWKSLTGDIR
ncbi:STAS domain-containing protein [Dactylosporangium roseum]|uniref:STAS domain-containing protein n=1 Tax=Dactylosporangium roseum TaxID=47989 RepID=A0ABY5YZZ5_9ACTN|nr:STAS domain-containing protein [Dactylosporangium roseum]UWZ33809.1 STAS domain-containing protein [Dactylosporangium roseum]